MPPRPAKKSGKKRSDEPPQTPNPMDDNSASTNAQLSALTDSNKIFVPPPNQVCNITEEQLNEELTKILRASNPYAPDNITHFSYKERAFKVDTSVDQLEVHFARDGRLLPLSSDEGRRQREHEERLKDAAAAADGVKKAEAEASEEDARALRNQFNFSERTTQTFNNALRERGTMTDPPPSIEYASEASPWSIYDAYMEDIEQKREMERKAKLKKGENANLLASATAASMAAPAANPESELNSDRLAHSAKILERMVNQNTYDDITQDYKYWEDASDVYREGEGTLLPLWKFYHESTKRKHVTAVRWNPEFPDLFAVGYGSYDFMKQGMGMICLYTLKNPTFPEFHCQTESGVMCLDWHPQHSALLCAGLYDGTVAVFDVKVPKTRNPIFASSVKTGKHTDPVWEVCWQEEDLAKNLNFFSISSDGRITLWTLAKSELDHADLMHLQLKPKSEETEEEEAAISGFASGCCFDFSRLSEHLFLVGTEEGRIHKCSKAYNSQYLETYDGHYMAVYTVRWNPFNPKIFISCSADWTVKLWEHTHMTPIISLDLNNQVGDVTWSPWSSTTFAACTADGKVHVYDLHENRNEPMCEQKIVRKAKLTKLAFNLEGDKCPVLLVGDDHSCVSSLKLSPNLRWTAVTKAEAERKAKEEAEAAAAGAGPRRGMMPKKVVNEAEKRDPRELELEKLEAIVDMHIKNLVGASHSE